MGSNTTKARNMRKNRNGTWSSRTLLIPAMLCPALALGAPSMSIPSSFVPDPSWEPVHLTGVCLLRPFSAMADKTASLYQGVSNCWVITAHHYTLWLLSVRARLALFRWQSFSCRTKCGMRIQTCLSMLRLDLEEQLGSNLCHCELSEFETCRALLHMKCVYVGNILCYLAHVRDLLHCQFVIVFPAVVCTPLEPRASNMSNQRAPLKNMWVPWAEGNPNPWLSKELPHPSLSPCPSRFPASVPWDHVMKASSKIWSGLVRKMQTIIWHIIQHHFWSHFASDWRGALKW